MNATRFLDTNILLYAYDLAAARASGVKELLTEDLNHGQNYGGVRVVNPFR
jgi:predicted nucleic acid-binding protein